MVVVRDEKRTESRIISREEKNGRRLLGVTLVKVRTRSETREHLRSVKDSEETTVERCVGRYTITEPRMAWI